MRKKLFATLLALCMALILLPGTALAAEEEGGGTTEEEETPVTPDTSDPTYSGSCGRGTNATWEYDDSTKTLTIDGSGMIEEIDWWQVDGDEYDWDIIIDSLREATALVFAENSSITEIGWLAFSNCTSLNRVTLPATVGTIDNGAFVGCANLTAFEVEGGNETYSAADGFLLDQAGTTLLLCPEGKSGECRIPAGVESISYGAFENCEKITSIHLPKEVTDIWDGFSGCSSLISITVDAENSEYSAENGLLLNKAGTTLFRCPTGKEGECTIPDGVTSISNRAFENCEKITSIYLPKEVTSIGSMGMFGGCTSLTAFEVESDNETYSATDGFLLNKTGNTLLRCPTGIVSCKIPESVVLINTGAFEGCSEITDLTLPGAPVWSGNDLRGIGDKLTVATISDGTTQLADTFGNCRSLTTVYLPASLTVIGTNTFYSSGPSRNQLETVHFAGTEAQWKAITVGSGNDALSKANIICEGNTAAETPAKYTLTVTGGKVKDMTAGSDGKYAVEAGKEVEITADSAETFGKWKVEGITPALSDEDLGKATLKFEMPANAVTVEATAKEPPVKYTLTVTGGKVKELTAGSDGKYAVEVGKEIEITADPAETFDKWKVEGLTPALSDAELGKTPLKFKMPANAVTVTANYKSASTPTDPGSPGKLTITSANGGLGKNLKVTVAGGHWLTVQVTRNNSIAISSIQAPGSGTVTVSFSAAEGSKVQVLETEKQLTFTNGVPTGKVLNVGTTTA